MASIPKWETTHTKSKKWGKEGVSTSIIGTITVGEDGGTSVKYTTGDDTGDTNKFANYMSNGAE